MIKIELQNKIYMKKYFKILVVLSLIWTIQSCGSDENEQEQEQEVLGNCIAEWFSNQTDLILEAGVEFGTNPTDENCKAYQDAIMLWIDEAEDCNLVTQADIDQLQIDLEELDCN